MSKMNLQQTEEFWRAVMPPGVTCSDEGFGNWLEKLQNALAAEPEVDSIQGNTFSSDCCNTIVDRLDSLRAGFELRQINLLREMISRGGGEIGSVVNMALSIHKSLTPDRVEAFATVLDAFDKLHNGHGLKMLVDYVVISDILRADDALFIFVLAGKDVVGLGDFRKRLTESGVSRLVRHMLTCGVDPFDRALLDWQRGFAPKNNGDESVLRLWRSRVESHPDWAVGTAQLAALQNTQKPWRAADFLQKVDKDGPRVIDIAALSGNAGAVLRADRWVGRFDDFNRVVKALEETMAVLPVDKAVVSAQIRAATLQTRQKPTVRFGK